jgi:hypothetical protein
MGAVGARVLPFPSLLPHIIVASGYGGPAFLRGNLLLLLLLSKAVVSRRADA